MWRFGREWIERAMALYRIDGIEDRLAQKIGDSLDALGKDFKPHDVVEAASHPGSPLNPFFQWDDTKAAAEYRLSQARNLIQAWEVEDVIHLFDGLFLGGTDEFKKEAEDWKNIARIACKRFHYGRAGTERKIKHALKIGADSMDSAFPLWNFQRIARMEYLVHEWQEREPVLDFTGGKL